MCLAGAVVVSWCLTQEVASSNPFNDKHVLETFREKYQAILPIPPIKYNSLRDSICSILEMSRQIIDIF